MMLDNKTETKKTITYLRLIADKLERGEFHLTEVFIESRCINWNIEEEEVSIKTVKAVNNG